MTSASVTVSPVSDDQRERPADGAGAAGDHGLAAVGERIVGPDDARPHQRRRDKRDDDKRPPPARRASSCVSSHTGCLPVFRSFGRTDNGVKRRSAESPHAVTRSDRTALFDAYRRTNWVRLRTLMVLRWIAIAGQLTAIIVARQALQPRAGPGAVLPGRRRRRRREPDRRCSLPREQAPDRARGRGDAALRHRRSSRSLLY